MSRPKPFPHNFSAKVPAGPDASQRPASPRPKVLKGMAMPAYDLPKTFDLTVHEQLRVSGNVRPVTRTELAARIKALKQKKPQLG